jgi:hypothetical protein
MNPGQSLPLRDIHLPDSVSWWPPAIGWWIVLLIGLLVIVGLVLWIRKLLQPKMNKRARDEVSQIVADYQSDHDKLKLVQQLSAAIRRIGISYLTRKEYAGLVGEAWYQRINELAPAHAFDQQSIALLVEIPYRRQPEIDATSVQHLIDQAKTWAQALPVNPVHKLPGKAQHV